MLANKTIPMNETRNAYEDEQEELDKLTEEEVAVWASIADLLTEAGYRMENKLIDGQPETVLIKE